MPEENGARVLPAWVAWLLGTILFMSITFTAYVATQSQGTENQQSAVAAVQETVKEDISRMSILINENNNSTLQALNDLRNIITALPSQIDDKDRWYKETELEYQKRADSRDDDLQRQIDELKLYHFPYQSK